MCVNYVIILKCQSSPKVNPKLSLNPLESRLVKGTVRNSLSVSCIELLEF